MALIFTWLLRLAGAMIALVVVGVGMVYYLGARSLPDNKALL